MSTSHPNKKNSTSSTDTSPKVPVTRHWLPWVAVVGGVCVLVLAGLVGVAYTTQARTIVRSSRVAGQDVGGLTNLSALQQVQQQWTAFTAGAYHFTLNGDDISLPTSSAAPSDSEVVLDLTSLDIERAVSEAYDYGHTGPLWKQAMQRFSGFIGRRHQFGLVQVDQSGLADALHQQVNEQESAAVNAGLTIANSQVSAVTPSADGRTVDYAGALHQAVLRARQLDTTPVVLTMKIVHPDVPDDASLRSLADQQVPALIEHAPLTLTLDKKTWTISAAKLATLLGFYRNAQGEIAVGFDAAKTNAYLAGIAKDVRVDAQNAKLSITNGHVQEFQTSVVGRTLNTEQTYLAMQQTLIEQRQQTVGLAVDEIQPATSSLGNNDLGITELVAEGTTNFKGSPTNRRFNLSLGARLLNGLLIAPGQEFSLVKALGPIDSKHGWKPELVIKGSAITPEFGGGLCQVATTLFRAALNTGLPITERHNHSLRIHYYEPPVGLDATIYEPRPDLRFVNDYGHYLLLQTEVNGNDLTFRFYGTKEGRVVDIPTPVVYNRTPIPATKTIEVDDLKPGQKECQAPGHPGADAIATYTVTKADGTKVTQKFTSHYRALGVLCRVGKKAAPKPATTTNTNTSGTTPTQ